MAGESDEEFVLGWRATKELGKGGYGVVNCAQLWYSLEALPVTVAVKSLLTPRDAENNRIPAGHGELLPKSTLAEILSIAIPRHPHLCLPDAVVRRGDRTHIVMPMAAGCLFPLVTSRMCPLPLWRIWCWQLARALAHMHAAGFWHRDIKVENVLRLADGSVQLADLGVARPEALPMLSGADAGATAHVGSRLTRAWEMLPTPTCPRREYTSAVDVWSMGITFAAVAAGGYKIHFASDIAGQTALLAKNEASFSTHADVSSLLGGRAVGANAQVVLQGMLATNPVVRMTAADVLRSSWLSSITDAEAQATIAAHRAWWTRLDAPAAPPPRPTMPKSRSKSWGTPPSSCPLRSRLSPEATLWRRGYTISDEGGTEEPEGKNGNNLDIGLSWMVAWGALASRVPLALLFDAVQMLACVPIQTVRTTGVHLVAAALQLASKVHLTAPLNAAKLSRILGRPLGVVEVHAAELAVWRACNGVLVHCRSTRLAACLAGKPKLVIMCAALLAAAACGSGVTRGGDTVSLALRLQEDLCGSCDLDDAWWSAQQPRTRAALLPLVAGTGWSADCADTWRAAWLGGFPSCRPDNSARFRSLLNCARTASEFRPTARVPKPEPQKAIVATPREQHTSTAMPIFEWERPNCAVLAVTSKDSATGIGTLLDHGMLALPMALPTVGGAKAVQKEVSSVQMTRLCGIRVGGIEVAVWMGGESVAQWFPTALPPPMQMLCTRAWIAIASPVAHSASALSAWWTTASAPLLVGRGPEEGDALLAGAVRKRSGSVSVSAAARASAAKIPSYAKVSSAKRQRKSAAAADDEDEASDASSSGAEESDESKSQDDDGDGADDDASDAGSLEEDNEEDAAAEDDEPQKRTKMLADDFAE